MNDDKGSYIKNRNKNVKSNSNSNDNRSSDFESSENFDSNIIDEGDDNDNVRYSYCYCCNEKKFTCNDFLNMIYGIRRTDVLSGLLNGFIMFVFSSTYSFLIFDETGLEQAVPVGVSIHTITAFVSGIAFAIFSTIPMTIAGPDTQTAVFAASMATIIRDIVIFNPDSKGQAPEAIKLLQETQYGSNSKNYNEAQQEILKNVTLEDYPAILPSILVSFMISTAIVSTLFLFLGYFRLTRIIQFLPSAVLSGFIAAIGFIVLIKSLQVSAGSYWTTPLTSEFWQMVSPAIFLGVSLYVMKRRRLMKLGVLFAIGIILPNALFYSIVYGVNSSIEQARDEGWLFEVTKSVPFYEQWIWTFGPKAIVDWKAVSSTVPIMMIMVFVVCVDFMLKLVGSKKMAQALGISFEKEMILAGKINLLLVFCVGQPGYTQHRFNLINQEIVNDSETQFMQKGLVITARKSALKREGSEDEDIEIDVPSSSKRNRFQKNSTKYGKSKSSTSGKDGENKKPKSSAVPGVVCGLFNGILFFTQFQLINYIPRFMIGGLLLFSALGLLVENLWDTRHHLTRLEFVTVWIIFFVEAFDTLLLAIFVGIVLAALGFAVQYAQTGVIRAIISGSDYQSSVVRSAQEDRKLEHLGSQCLVVVLSRFIFFGSASQVLDAIRNIIRDEISLLTCGKVRYIIFDWEHVHGIDYTASNVFLELVQQLRNGFQLDTEFNKADEKNAANGNYSPKKTSNALNNEIIVIFTGMSTRVRQALKSEGVIELLYENPEDADVEYINSIKIQANAQDSSSSNNQNITFSKSKFLNSVSNWFTSVQVKNSINSSSLNGIQENENKFLAYSQRRCFETLDLGIEWVEERLLEHASIIRKRWLNFESFRRLHEQARLKAEHEAFEHVLGGHLGNMLWKYVTPLDVPQGWTLCRTGHVNPHLYLLQKGRLTIYLESAERKRIVRLQSLRRGAFVNADALFVDTPVSHTIIADVDCKVLAISREKLKSLEAQNPEVAFEIHRNVLRHTARTRDKLARELDALDSWIHLSDVNGKNGIYSSSRRFGGGKGTTKSRAVRSKTQTSAFSEQNVNVWSLFSNGETTKEKITYAMKLVLSGKLAPQNLTPLAESSAEHYKFINKKSDTAPDVALILTSNTNSAPIGTEKKIKFGGDVVTKSRASKFFGNSSLSNEHENDDEAPIFKSGSDETSSFPILNVNQSGPISLDSTIETDQKILLNENNNFSSSLNQVTGIDSANLFSSTLKNEIKIQAPPVTEPNFTADKKENEFQKPQIETKISGLSQISKDDISNLHRSTTPRLPFIRQASVDVAADIGPSNISALVAANGQGNNSQQIPNSRKNTDDIEQIRYIDNAFGGNEQNPNDVNLINGNFSIHTANSSASLGSKKLKNVGFSANDQIDGALLSPSSIERPLSSQSQTNYSQQESIENGSTGELLIVKKISDTLPKEDFISPPPLRYEPKMFKKLLHPETTPTLGRSHASSNEEYANSNRTIKNPKNLAIDNDALLASSDDFPAKSSSTAHARLQSIEFDAQNTKFDILSPGHSRSDSTKMPMHPGVSTTLAQSIISKSPPLRSRLSSNNLFQVSAIASSSTQVEPNKIGNVTIKSNDRLSSLGLSLGEPLRTSESDKNIPFDLNQEASKAGTKTPLIVSYKPKLSESKKMDAIGCFSRAVETHRHLLLGREDNELEAEYNRLNANLLPRNVLLQSLMDLGLFPTEMELEKLLQNIRSKERLKRRAHGGEKIRNSFSSTRSSRSANSSRDSEEKAAENGNDEGNTFRKRDPRGSFQDVGGFITIDLGHLFDEANRPISEKEFLKLVRSLSLAELDQDQLSKFAAVFMEYAVDIAAAISPHQQINREPIASGTENNKKQTRLKASLSNNTKNQRASRSLSSGHVPSFTNNEKKGDDQYISESDGDVSDSYTDPRMPLRNVTPLNDMLGSANDALMAADNDIISTEKEGARVYGLSQDSSKSLQDRLSSRDNITMEDLKQKVLTVDGLSKLMEDFGHPEDLVALHRLVAEWSTLTSNLKHRAVSFNSFCCMLANILKMEKLEDRVEADWAKFVGSNGNIMTYLVTPNDILKAMPYITHQEAVEMIWEADIDEVGGITLSNFIDTITTVWDPEISQNYEAQQIQLQGQREANYNENKGAPIGSHEGKSNLHGCVGLDEFQPISSLIKREKPSQMFPQFVPSKGVLKKTSENSPAVSFETLANGQHKKGSVLLAPSSRRRARSSSTSGTDSGNNKQPVQVGNELSIPLSIDGIKLEKTKSKSLNPVSDASPNSNGIGNIVDDQTSFIV